MVDGVYTRVLSAVKLTQTSSRLVPL